jgi:hypothetical protein
VLSFITVKESKSAGRTYSQLMGEPSRITNNCCVAGVKKCAKRRVCTRYLSSILHIGHKLLVFLKNLHAHMEFGCVRVDFFLGIFIL